MRNRDRLSSPNEFCTTLPEFLPAMDGMLAWISIGSSIPSFHGLNGDSVANLDFAARERLAQRRIGSAKQFVFAWNRQPERLNMLLKARNILHGAQPKNRGCDHVVFFPVGSLATAAKPSKAIAIGARKPAV
jgi:hypothetical protein